MGMDYQYMGSASYPRFDEELCAVASVFGGKKTEHLQARKNGTRKGSLDYWFGFLSSDHSGEEKFVFPKGTNETLVKWFNHIYGDFTEKETQTIWEIIRKHPEIKEISYQIWSELEILVSLKDSWHIC